MQGVGKKMTSGSGNKNGAVASERSSGRPGTHPPPKKILTSGRKRTKYVPKADPTKATPASIGLGGVVAKEADPFDMSEGGRKEYNKNLEPDFEKAWKVIRTSMELNRVVDEVVKFR